MEEEIPIEQQMADLQKKESEQRNNLGKIEEDIQETKRLLIQFERASRVKREEYKDRISDLRELKRQAKHCIEQTKIAYRIKRNEFFSQR